MRIPVILAAVFIFMMIGCEKDENIDDSHWVYVKGGTFAMGSTKDKPDGTPGNPGHTVTLSDFYISKYEVTNAQFADFLNVYKSDKVKAGVNAGKTMYWEHIWGVEKTDSTWASVHGYENFPALNISWEGANEYCLFNGWRLPTEAEWEYAARGGCKSEMYWYSGSDSIDLVAWYEPKYEGRPGTNSHPVGLKTANELGIYDMTGNIWEWVYDFYASYPDEAVTNPTGPETGKNHVYRGGAWLSIKINCTTVFRGGGGIDYHGVTHNGIRCVKMKK
jgi:formylglycine-generating enzyme required for sulfatase activity